MYDDICHLVGEYTWSPSFNRYAKLKSQKSFLRSMQETHSTHGLRPKKINVRLHTGTMVTVPVFDTKEMIISILTDKTLMTDKNFAEGYNVLLGDVDPNKTCNEKYGEVHTGDAWIPARNRYC
jgi:hypothetical protein